MRKRLSGLLLLISLAGVAQKPAAHQEVLDGFAYFQNGDNDHAIVHYDKAIVLDPGYADAYYYRGSAYWKSGNLDRALADLNTAIGLHGDDPDYFGERGNVYAQQKEYEKAESDFKRSLALNGRNPIRWYNYGKMLYAQEKYATAVDLFSKAIALNPGYITAYASRGECHYLLGEQEGAIQDLTQVIVLTHNNRDLVNRIDFKLMVWEALYERGSVFGEMKQYDKAEKDLTECIALDNAKTKGYENRGYYRLMNGQYETAIQDFDHVIQLDSTDALAYNNRGLAQYFLKHYDQAEADCRRSMTYKPDNSYVWLNLGKINLATGKKEQACEMLGKAVQLGNKEAEGIRKGACQ